MRMHGSPRPMPYSNTPSGPVSKRARPSELLVTFNGELTSASSGLGKVPTFAGGRSRGGENHLGTLLMFHGTVARRPGFLPAGHDKQQHMQATGHGPV